MERDLFDDVLRNLHNCQYISDLRTIVDKHDTRELLNIISKLNYDDYTTQQWCDFIYYVFQKREEYKTNEEAYKTIIKLLK